MALADGFDELAHADLAVGGGRQHGEEPETDRITQRAEARGQLGGLVAIEGSPEDRRAALDFVFSPR